MITALLLLLLGLLLIALIIAANGYFVAQEFAFMSVDRARLRAQAENGDPAARRALAVTRRTSFMLSGAQLGITVTGLLVGYVAEPLVGESLGALLGLAGVPAAVGITVGTVLALVAATVVQIIFGELFPKNLAIAAPEPLAKALAPSTRAYLTIFGWLIVIFDVAANAFLRLLRVEPVHDLDSAATSEDLERIIDDSRDSGDLPRDLSLLLDRILDFPQRDVAHAMIPRPQVGVLEPEASIMEIRDLMAGGHSRYPVVDEADVPLGVVHLSDILGVRVADRRVAAEIMRPALVIPETMPLPAARAELTRTRNELACVIDEHGGLAGVLTTEDLAEELVGEITDEHDVEAPTAVTATENEWVMDGDMHLDEAERTIGRDLPPTDAETIAGLLLSERKALLAVGDRVRIILPLTPTDVVEDDPEPSALIAEVLEVQRYVPSRVRIRVEDLRGEISASDDVPAHPSEGVTK